MYPFVCKAYKPDRFADMGTYLEGLPFNLFRPKFVTVHNTAPPTLADYANWKRPDRRGGPVSDEQWAHNLESFYRYTQKWSGGPHFAVTPEGAIVLSPPNYPGVHTPSWNRISWGVETVGDFEVDAFDGAIRDNLIQALAVMHHAAGLDPLPFELGHRGLHFHKEDAGTTHRTCPGRHMDKAKLVADVIEAMAKLQDASGDAHHDETIPEPVAKPPAPLMKLATINVLPNDFLNVRAGSGAQTPRITRLKRGDRVIVVGSAMNGPTKWLEIKTGNITGWVADRFVTLV